jgi:hypothetical protein
MTWPVSRPAGEISDEHGMAARTWIEANDLLRLSHMAAAKKRCFGRPER